MDIAGLLEQDAREKRRNRGGQAVAKKRPRVLLMPASNWKTAAVLVKVDIASGAVLVNRWPL
ncbi:MAG: hypothetical protein K6T66_13135 [Peptococcaceae bacterium]|nr:hypothetical protein [Peptococcaceae bacterium]